MGYLICGKCKNYYKLQSDESAKDFVDHCDCGGKLRYVENLDIVDPNWKQAPITKKSTKREILRNKIQSLHSIPNLNLKTRLVQFWNNHRYKIHNAQNWNNNYNTHYNRETGLIGLINSIKNELNFNNIRWPLVIPVTMAITVIFTITQGILTLLIFLLLAAVGYLFKTN